MFQISGRNFFVASNFFCPNSCSSFLNAYMNSASQGMLSFVRKQFLIISNVTLRTRLKNSFVAPSDLTYLWPEATEKIYFNHHNFGAHFLSSVPEPILQALLSSPSSQRALITGVTEPKLWDSITANALLRSRAAALGGIREPARSWPLLI